MVCREITVLEQSPTWTRVYVAAKQTCGGTSSCTFTWVKVPGGLIKCVDTLRVVMKYIFTLKYPNVFNDHWTVDFTFLENSPPATEITPADSTRGLFVNVWGLDKTGSHWPSPCRICARRGYETPVPQIKKIIHHSVTNSMKHFTNI